MRKMRNVSENLGNSFYVSRLFLLECLLRFELDFCGGIVTATGKHNGAENSLPKCFSQKKTLGCSCCSCSKLVSCKPVAHQQFFQLIVVELLTHSKSFVKQGRTAISFKTITTSLSAERFPNYVVIKLKASGLLAGAFQIERLIMLPCLNRSCGRGSK